MTAIIIIAVTEVEHAADQDHETHALVDLDRDRAARVAPKATNTTDITVIQRADLDHVRAVTVAAVAALDAITIVNLSVIAREVALDRDLSHVIDEKRSI